MRVLSFTYLQTVMMVGIIAVLGSTTLSCSDDDPLTIRVPGCRLNSDCPADQICNEGQCVVDDNACTGPDCPCASHGDCAPGQSCDVETGQCFELECVSDTGCALGEVCQSGRCVTDVEADRDRDGVPDAEDSCPQVANADQDDFDGDGAGDLCDDDDDNDGRADTLDNCPLADNPIQGDADGDGQGNACDGDTPAIDITGTLNFTAIPNADTAQAQIFITGRIEPVGIGRDGRFAIEDALSEPGDFFLTVRWPGFETTVQQATAPDTTPTVELPDIVLQSASQGDEAVLARGQVQLEGLESSADVVIRAEIEGVLAQTTLSDDEGRFVMSLAPVTHTLRLSKAGFEPLEVTALFNTQGPQEGSFTIDEVPIEEAELTLSAVPVATLEGTLSSPLNPQDWPSRALVTLVSQDQTLTRIAPVLNRQQGQDNVGAFQLTGLPVGDYTLFVSARGHLPVQIDIAADDLQDLEETLPTIELEREATAALMRGRVRLLDVDAEADQSNVIVRAAVSDQTVATAVTDAQGNFVFSSSRENHTLTFSKTGYLPIDAQVSWNTQTERFERGDTPLEDPEAAFELAPIATFAVRGSLSSTLGVITDWPSRAFATLLSEDASIRRIQSVLSDGSFEIVGLRPGQYNLSVAARGHNSVERLSLTIEDSSVGVGTIVLTPEAADDDGATLMRGVVRLSDEGEDGDHSGITVRGRDGGNLVFTTTTDDTGTFVAPVSRIDHILTFSKEEYQDSGDINVAWVPDEESDDEQAGQFIYEGAPLSTQRFTLTPRTRATISGTLTSPLDITDWPQRALISLIEDPQRLAVVVNQDEQGAFELSGLRPGTYTLNIQVEGHLPESRVVTLPGAGLTLGEVALNPVQVTFEGEVLEEDTTRLADVLVQVRRGETVAASTLSDEQGRFSVTLTPERHTLTLSKTGFLAHPEVTLSWNGASFDVESPVEGEPPFVMTALPTATVHGEVASGQGARNDWPNIAFVTLSNETQRRVVGVNNAEGGRGQFQFNGLTPGQYVLGISAQGHEPFAQQVTLASGDNSLASLIGQELVTLVPQQGDNTVLARANVRREDGLDNEHADIVVRAQVEGNLVATTLSADNGDFILSLARIDHTLSFSAPGYLPLRDVLMRWDEGDTRFEIDGQTLDEFEGLTLEPVTGQLQVNVALSPDWLPNGQRGVTVRVVGQQQRRSALADGAPVVFTNLPAGQYIVFTERAGFSLAQQVVTIDEQQNNAAITLETGLVSLATANLDLSGLSLTGTQLRQVPSLVGGNLAGVRFVGEEQGQGAQLCELDLGGVSLVGANLADAHMAGVNLTGARLDNATLENVVLTSARMDGASFFGANLSGVDLRNGPFECLGLDRLGTQTRMTGANFSSADMTGALFVAPDVALPPQPCLDDPNGPELSSVRWNQTDLSDAIMNGVDLRSAEITATLLIGTELRGACLEDTALLRADLTDADLTSANLLNADVLDVLALRTVMTSVRLEGANISGTNLSQATLDDIDGAGLSMAGVLLGGASFVNASMSASSWVGVLLNNVDLSGADLSQTDMRNTQFVDVTLPGTSFQDADLRNASLVQLNLAQVDLNGVRLNGADLAGANLEGAQLNDAELPGADFELARYNDQTQWPVNFEFRTVSALGPETQLSNILFPNNFDADGVDLSRAVLDGARMIGIQLSGALLIGANLQGATLTGADLSNADFTGADLDVANLVDATLVGINMTDVTLIDADLSGADPANAQLTLTIESTQGLRAVDLLSCPDVLPDTWRCIAQGNERFALVGSNLNLNNVNLNGSDLSGADLVGASVEGADLRNANLINTRAFDLQGCPALSEPYRCVLSPFSGTYLLTGPQVDLSGASATSADMQGVVLTGANLTGASATSADMQGVVLTGANLTGAALSDADLSDADLRDAILDGARLDDAILNHVDMRGASLDNTTFCILNGAECAFFSGPQNTIIGGVIEMALLRATDLRACPGNNSLPDGWTVSGDRFINEDTWRCLEQANGRFALVGPTADLSEVDLGPMDLSGFDLVGADLSDAAMANVTLDQVRAFNLVGCPTTLPTGWLCVEQIANGGFALIGRSADLVGADLSGMDLRGANLRDAHLSEANLTGANLSNLNLDGADLRSANLTGAILTGANLAGANLAGATSSEVASCPASLPSGWTCTANGQGTFEVAPPFITFVTVPSGTFGMGSPDTELGRGPGETLHSVTLTRSYLMQTTEVTQAQWSTLMGNNPSRNSNCGGDCPVEEVTWWDALAFANAMSAREGLAQCYTLQGCDGAPGTEMECTGLTINATGGNVYNCQGYRLPTEAEWERAARAGTQTAIFSGDLTVANCTPVEEVIDSVGFYCGNFQGGIQPVGQKLPNAYGIYDTVGNVLEWVFDTYRSDYQNLPGTDPVHFSANFNIERGISRGGNYATTANSCRAAARGPYIQSSAFNTGGFRLARTAP